MDMGNRIKAARLLAGLTNEELATLLGITRMNVIRWQSTGQLPLRQVRPLATATGFSEQWLRAGGDLEGFIVARPLRIDSRSPKNVLRSNAAYLSELLPRLCLGATVSELRASSGIAYLFTTQRYCLVVFAPQDLDIYLNLDLSWVLNQTSIDDAIWFAAYTGSQSAMMELLHKVKLDAWSKKMLNVPTHPQALSILKMEIRVQDAFTEPLVVAEVLQFIQGLRRRGGCEVTYDINNRSNRG